MATISLLKGGSTVGLGVCPTAQPGIVSIRITAAEALAAKGSAVAAADIINVMTIPAGTVVSGATINVLTADTGTALTFDLGDGTAVDEWVDGGDIKVAGYKAQGTNGIFDQRKLYTSADTLFITVATLTAASATWEVEVLLEYVDYTGSPRARSAKDNP